jgi:predicted DNA-binding transcriptional regulator
MESFFFRVEHDLLRSEAFKALSGSAIKVYLVIGLYADFETGWAYPSIRTIARQAGLSRQTVLAAIANLTRLGMLATSKSKGRATAYKIVRQAPERPSPRKGKASPKAAVTGPKSFEVQGPSGPNSFEVAGETGPNSFEALAQFLGPSGPEPRPKREPETREDDNAAIPIPGTPFRLTAEGRLHVAVDLQELLTDQGIPRHLAERLARQKDPEAVAKVLLNAFYLRSQGRLQNGPGYIRAGIEDGYELLPQVAHRLEARRRELEAKLRMSAARREQMRAESARAAEEAAINAVLANLRPDELQSLINEAMTLLPEPLVRRNPTLSNPFLRSKVYELAGGQPLS